MKRADKAPRPSRAVDPEVNELVEMVKRSGLEGCGERKWIKDLKYGGAG